MLGIGEGPLCAGEMRGLVPEKRRFSQVDPSSVDDTIEEGARRREITGGLTNCRERNQRRV